MTHDGYSFFTLADSCDTFENQKNHLSACVHPTFVHKKKSRCSHLIKNMIWLEQYTDYTHIKYESRLTHASGLPVLSHENTVNWNEFIRLTN